MKKRIGDFAAELYGAPAWLVVESVTIETEDGHPPVLVEPGSLERLKYPEGEFTLRVRVRPPSYRRPLESA